MKGADLSHWNKVTDWSKVANSGMSFCILKATQGKDWIDSKFEEYRKGAENAGLLTGFYHFADGDDVLKEAQHFIETVGEFKEGQLLVLDYEINLKNADSWCRDFLDAVYFKTGVRPLLYTNEARVKAIDWEKVVAGNFGLWVAKYGVNNGEMNTAPTSGQWPFWAIWQYTSRGKVPGIVGNVDLNFTKLDSDTLKKYGKPAMPPEPAGAPQSDFTPYSQSDPRWKDIVIGKSVNKRFTLGSDGCFITSLAMMTNTPPDETFKKLKEGGAITGGGMLDSVKAAKILKLKYNGKDYNINNEPQYSPSIKEVNYRRWIPGFSQHFVLRIIRNGKKSIIDPLGGVERKINYFPFKSYRLFK